MAYIATTDNASCGQLFQSNAMSHIAFYIKCAGSHNSVNPRLKHKQCTSWKHSYSEADFFNTTHVFEQTLLWGQQPEISGLLCLK